ncbi:uncharacterized protein LOC116925426 isoform X1 [Daphnia magna]|uniref:uncharacterized protein LOC116925426 isoform X1 n=2 Tax=Daphnia magna TaxID=35525 RepID=UPI001E1BC6A7|nr:uncharacterized protein LOC116925426 isoform X1 [Daphnia magna]
MDDLLHRLRHDMVELSSQGDNFTQQIWLMYGQFEQVVDRFNSPAESVRTERHWARRRVRTGYPTAMNKTGERHRVVARRSSSFVSDSESDSELEVPKMSGLARQGVYGSRSASSRLGLNPLLDTISVIGDLCDSDDAVDGPTSSATLYAGSNSVDSGYKSACPTPDCLMPAHDANNYISGRSALPPPVLPRSRPTLAAVADVRLGSSAPDAPLDLDHLTSLRRTLLTAIERYDTKTKELIDRDLPSKSIDKNLVQSSMAGKPESDRQVDDDVDVDRGCCKLPKGELKEPDNQQDGATRFSRVAHCMLEIIEDLQRQQQQQQQECVADAAVMADGPVVPPKPSRVSTAAPATPPRVARRGRRKLPTPTQQLIANDSVDSGSDLNGADYHLYEEIIYDLAGSNLALNSNEKNSTVSCPPPLPARPARPGPTVGSCLSNSVVKPWLNVIKPLRRDRNNQLIRNNTSSTSHCWTSKMANKLGHHTDVARSNVYTFASHPQHPPQQQTTVCHNNSAIINPFHPLPSRNSSAHHLNHEDEYGFRAVSHMV